MTFSYLTFETKKFPSVINTESNYPLFVFFGIKNLLKNGHLIIVKCVYETRDKFGNNPLRNASDRHFFKITSFIGHIDRALK